MQTKDWLPTLLTVASGLVLFFLGKVWEGRGTRSAAAKSYNEKVFSEMVTLFDELKDKAKDAEKSASEAKTLAAQVLNDSQNRVSEAQASAMAAQKSAMESQAMVAAGQAREAEVNRQLAKAWEKIDLLTDRVLDMERTNAGLVGGAIGLNPRHAKTTKTLIETQEQD